MLLSGLRVLELSQLIAAPLCGLQLGDLGAEVVKFEPPARLAWHGPPAKSGPGSMEPSGWWELSDEGTGTRVKLVMTPKPGGLFRLLAPLMSMGMRKGNAKALERLKQRLEGRAGSPPG